MLPLALERFLSDELLIAARTAMLVMDFQPGIVGRLADANALLARTADAIAHARAAGVTVGYVRVAFTDADYQKIPGTNKMFSALATSRPMHADAPDTTVHPGVAPHAGEIVVRKTRVGAFSTTDLDRQLRDRDIDTLVLAGVSTSGVVLSTVRAGSDLDYRLLVLSDCCDDPDPEVHAFLLERVFPRQATVTDSARFAAMLHP
jgi:nicotinamidase-related amidase